MPLPPNEKKKHILNNAKYLKSNLMFCYKNVIPLKNKKNSWLSRAEVLQVQFYDKKNGFLAFAYGIFFFLLFDIIT